MQMFEPHTVFQESRDLSESEIQGKDRTSSSCSDNIDNDIMYDEVNEEITHINLELLIKKILLNEISEFNYDIVGYLLDQITAFLSLEQFVIMIFEKKREMFQDDEKAEKFYLTMERFLMLKYASIKADKSLINLIQTSFGKLEENEYVLKYFPKLLDILHNLNDLEYTINDFYIANNLVYIDKEYDSAYILPTNLSTIFDVLEWNEADIAKHLTFLSQSFLDNIAIEELLLAQWTKQDKDILSPNVMKMIYRFNHISYWICEEILSYDKALHRYRVINKFLLIAKECRKMNNYNDCFNIVTALNTYFIKNLQKTWARVDMEHLSIFSELNTLCSCSKNYINLKEAVEANCYKPCIPYLGLMLKNLAFIEEGPKYLKEHRLINLNKLKKVGIILECHKNNRKHKYSLMPIFQLGFLAKPSPKNENELSEMADLLEPSFNHNRQKQKSKNPSATDAESAQRVNSEFVNILKGKKTKQSKNLREIIDVHQDD